MPGVATLRRRLPVLFRAWAAQPGLLSVVLQVRAVRSEIRCGLATVLVVPGLVVGGVESLRGVEGAQLPLFSESAFLESF